MITSTSTKNFTSPTPPTTVATSVETTHFIFSFSQGAGYMKQIFKDADDKTIGIRFLKITGTGYDTVETAILTKVQKVADDIELDDTIIDGVNIEEVDRSEALEVIRG